MERCGFFDANLVGEEYDRVYLAAQFASYFASFIGNGVFAEHSNQLQVFAMSTPQMQVTVEAGQGWINGYWYENTDELLLPIDVADGVLNRIDSVVLRFGTAERNMWLAIKKGTAAITPVAPTVTRNGDYYDLQLATISVPAGALNITQAQITDTRLNAAVCGWVTGVVQQIDTTTLFEQFETYFEEFKQFYEGDFNIWTTQQKSEYISWITGAEADMTDWTDEQKQQFNEWFDEIKNQLGEDVAGHLQSEVDRLDEIVEGYTEGVTTFSEDGNTITQNLQSGEVLVTTFVSPTEILQEWFNDRDIKVKQKRITFSPDGKTITETKEAI